MHPGDYPTPPHAENDAMDPDARLPPITTVSSHVHQKLAARANICTMTINIDSKQQLTEFFPKEKLSTPPVSPEDLRQSQSVLKRKRSDDGPLTNDSRPDQGKRPALESGAKWPERRPIPPVVAETAGPARSVASLPAIPALEPSLLSSPPRKEVPAYTGRPSQGTTSQASLSRSSEVSFGAHSYKPSYSEQVSTTGPERSTGPPQFSQVPGRDLPPLTTPQSPRSHLDRHFAKDSTSVGPMSLPPIQPVADYRAATLKYTHPAHMQSGGTSTAVVSYPPPKTMRSDPPEDLYGRVQVQSRLVQPITSLTGGRPPYLDPASLQIGESHSLTVSRKDSRELPPMHVFADHVTPFQTASGQTLGSSSTMHPSQPSHSGDRYRFDPNPPTDHPARRRRGNLPKEATARLNQWFAEHASYPYPKEEEKQRLQGQTGLTMSQIGNWFINARRRRRPSTTTRIVDQQPPYHPQGFPPSYSQGPSLPPSLPQPPGPSPYCSNPERPSLPPPFDYSNRLPPYQRPTGQ